MLSDGGIYLSAELAQEIVESIMYAHFPNESDAEVRIPYSKVGYACPYYMDHLNSVYLFYDTA